MASIEQWLLFFGLSSQHIIRCLHTYCCCVFEPYSAIILLLMCALAFSSVHLFSLHLDLFEVFVWVVVLSCSMSTMLLERLMGESKMLMFSSTNVSVLEKFYRHMLLVLIRCRRRRCRRRHRRRIPFTIIAFQMAYGFHFLSFRNDFQQRFPFIFIHLHNSMHLETLMCVCECVCHCTKRKSKKREPESALCQSLGIHS